MKRLLGTFISIKWGSYNTVVHGVKFHPIKFCLTNGVLFQLRRFVQKYSVGLRARTNPSLQSEQMGVIPPEGIISFVDEVS